MRLRHLAKHSRLAAAVSLATCAGTAKATLLVYDSYDYTTGTNNLTGQTIPVSSDPTGNFGFVSGSAYIANQMSVEPGSLYYSPAVNFAPGSGVFASVGGKIESDAGGGTGNYGLGSNGSSGVAAGGRPFAGNASTAAVAPAGTYYYSFLWSPGNATAASGFFNVMGIADTGADNNYQNGVGIRFTNNNIYMNALAGGTNASSSVATFPSSPAVYLIVGKAVLNGGSSTNQLWVDPTTFAWNGSNGTISGGTATPVVNMDDQNNTVRETITSRTNGSAGNNGWWADEVRVGSSLADVVAIGNNSVITASTTPINFGRVMSGYAPSSTVSVNQSSGTSATHYVANAPAGITTSCTGTLPGTLSVSLATTPGAYSGAVSIQNTPSGTDNTGGTLSSGYNFVPGGTGANQSSISIAVTGTVLANRIISAGAVNLGLVHVNNSASGTATLSTSLDHNHATDLVVNGATFNNASATTTVGMGTFTFNTSGSVSSSVNVNLTVTGEGLAGEVDQNSVSVPYTASVFSGSATYSGGAGNYSTNSLWTDDSTPAINAAPGLFAGFVNTDRATFNGAGGSVSIDSNPSLNTLVLDGANAYSLTNGGGSLTISDAITANTAGHSIAAPIALAGNTTVSVATGTLTVGGTINGSGYSLAKTGAGTLSLSSSNTYSGGTNISSGLVVASAGLSALGSGTVAVNGGGLILSSTTPGLVFPLLRSGYNGGTWNGSTASSINSASAANDLSHLHALGMYQPSIAATFEGQPLGTGDVAIKYTYYGDANLDGAVDGSDYSDIDYGYLKGLTGWQNGDFNYDGVVDGSDYTLIDNAFNTQGAQISAEIAAPTAQIAPVAGTSAVPEPATLGLLGIGAVALLGRRSRRHC